MLDCSIRILDCNLLIPYFCLLFGNAMIRVGLAILSVFGECCFGLFIVRAGVMSHFDWSRGFKWLFKVLCIVWIWPQALRLRFL